MTAVTKIIHAIEEGDPRAAAPLDSSIRAAALLKAAEL